ncbi:MAG: phosphate/phosphite/phosphonate ABC transporter substrate-binding protein [Pseudomonadota bacterium]|nr:phosphate/phosphite/phosphonate ABC transporter substrate-binding protein [Pseudomonadota bacterium]
MKYIYSTLFLLIATLTGCSQQDASPRTPEIVQETDSVIEYRFAIHPLHNPTRLFEVFNPLLEYLNSNIPGVNFILEASRDYATFDNKLKTESVPFALPNPYQTLMAIDHNYQVIAKMGDDLNFRGIILVRKDSGIQIPTDLKGMAVSYPAPTALAATILPQYYLHNHGLDINKDIENKYVGSQESSIMNVFLGTTAAGATWPPPWKALSNERPELKKQLKVIWETQSLPNNSVVVRDDVPKELATQVQTLLSNLHTTTEGQKILQKMYLSKYETANNETYLSVKQFVTQFDKTVRPL